jgi:hypothetical protein
LHPIAQGIQVMKKSLTPTPELIELLIERGRHIASTSFLILYPVAY